MSEMDEAGKKSDRLTKADLDRPVAVRKIRLSVPRFLATGGEKGVEPYFFKPKQHKFLEVYAETGDVKKACQESGLPLNMVKKNDYICQEMALIEKAFQVKHRVKMAMPNHQRLMSKFEKDYDNLPNMQKPSMASVISRMSEATLKASGEFAEERHTPVHNGVQVIINLGPEEDEGDDGFTGQVIDVNVG